MRLLPLAFLICLSLLMTACDAVAHYTIDNRTDRVLLTWGLREKCSDEIGNGDEYLREHSVPPETATRYEEIYSGFPPYLQCIQVATYNRQLILSQPFDEGGVYVIEEPITPGVFVPQTDELPDRSVSESWREGWLTELFFWVPALLVLAALLYGGYCVILTVVRSARSNT